MEERLPNLQLPLDSDRIWRGSYKGKDWRHLVSCGTCVLQPSRAGCGDCPAEAASQHTSHTSPLRLCCSHARPALFVGREMARGHPRSPRTPRRHSRRAMRARETCPWASPLRPAQTQTLDSRRQATGPANQAPRPHPRRRPLVSPRQQAHPSSQASSRCHPQAQPPSLRPSQTALCSACPRTQLRLRQPQPRRAAGLPVPQQSGCSHPQPRAGRSLLSRRSSGGQPLLCPAQCQSSRQPPCPGPALVLSPSRPPCQRMRTCHRRPHSPLRRLPLLRPVRRQQPPATALPRGLTQGETPMPSQQQVQSRRQVPASHEQRCSSLMPTASAAPAAKLPSGASGLRQPLCSQAADLECSSWRQLATLPPPRLPRWWPASSEQAPPWRLCSRRAALWHELLLRPGPGAPFLRWPSVQLRCMHTTGESPVSCCLACVAPVHTVVRRMQRVRHPILIRLLCRADPPEASTPSSSRAVAADTRKPAFGASPASLTPSLDNAPVPHQPSALGPGLLPAIIPGRQVSGCVAG